MSSASTIDRPQATPAQGWILISVSWLAVMAPAVIAPVLPRMTVAYRGVPHEAVMIALAATLPALFVALLAVPSGILADRIGSRLLLLLGLGIYALTGTAPLWVPSLTEIVVSRAGVGISEALILTCSTALLGQYFSGDRRAKWFALQTGSANIIAIGITALSGFLGDRSWRTPFLVYGLSLLQVPLVLSLIRDPRHSLTLGRPLETETRSAPPLAEEGTAFRWTRLIGICALTFFASTAFYVVVVQMGFLLAERGITEPKMIGRGTGLAILSLPLGAALSRLLKTSYRSKLCLSFLLSAVGFITIARAHTFGATVGGGAITDLGSGIALTTLVTWALSSVPVPLRGRATGSWQAAFSFGQFASPLVMLTLAAWLGGRAHAVLLYAALCGLATLLLGASVLVIQRNSQLSPG